MNWISVKDRLPETPELALVWSWGDPYLASWVKNYNNRGSGAWADYLEGGEILYVTHWIPISPPILSEHSPYEQS